MSDKSQVLRTRHRIFSEIRRYFDAHDFIEVQTPLLVPNPGLEPYLIPFETRYVPGLGGGESQGFYLPTSPEYHLKKALALGIPRLFELTRSFRNGEKSREHEPEFWMLEWYRHPGTYFEIASDFNALLTMLGSHFALTADRPKWAHRHDLTVRDAFKRYCGLDLDAALEGRHSLTQQAIEKGFKSIAADDDFETCFNKLLVEKIERELGFDGPVFLWDYPASMCALSRVKPENPLYCERFEVYWKGIELANAFGELTDPVEQRHRCEEDRAKRRYLYGTTPPLDEEFLTALGKLHHPAAGIAVGVDRLIQCLLGFPRVQDVIAFPHWPSI